MTILRMFIILSEKNYGQLVANISQKLPFFCQLYSSTSRTPASTLPASSALRWRIRTHVHPPPAGRQQQLTASTCFMQPPKTPSAPPHSRRQYCQPLSHISPATHVAHTAYAKYSPCPYTHAPRTAAIQNAPCRHGLLRH